MPRLMRSPVLAVALVGAALALTACGGGSSESAADLPGGLEPQPLSEPTTITVAMGTAAEFIGAMLVAKEVGEFERENLTVDLVELPSAESLPALAQGRVDAASAGVGAAFLNAVAAESDIRLVFPGATKVPADGLYVALDPSTGEPKTIEKIAAISGPIGTNIVPIQQYLESVGQSVADVGFERVQLADMPAALDSGAVQAAWVNAPVTSLLEESGKYARVIGYEEGQYGAGYLFGPNLLRDKPEVGQAFVRALARTARDHLSGDYKQNADTVAALAAGLGSTPDEVTSTPSLTFSAILPTDTIQAAQGAWISIGDILDVDEPLTPDEYLEASFLDRAVGSS